MSVLEARDEKRFVDWLKANKIKWKQKGFGERLDRWLLLPEGKLFIVELKRAGKGELAPRQIKAIREIRELGHDIEVHDNADEAIEAVKVRLEASRLSKEGREVSAAKLIRGSILRSRAREDKYKPRRYKGSSY